ncbi:MAG: hypothetical protein ACJA1A_002681 [Saprospiraceae bacterium]|jgi:hypothetical protein
MKKIIFTLAFFFFCLSSGFSQGCINNPSIQGGDINPAPLEDGNGGQLFFTYVENGEDYTDEENDPVTLTICLLNIGPVDEVNSIGGSFSSTFDWQYDPVTNCFLGTQNQDIIGGEGGMITVDFEQTNTIDCPSNQMGFNANIQPAACMNGTNQVDDDNEFSFTCNTTTSVADSDGDGDPDGSDPDPADPCIFTAGSTADTTNAVWQAADCDGDGDPNGTDPDPTNPCIFTAGSTADTTNAVWQAADCDGDGDPNGTDPDPYGGICINNPSIQSGDINPAPLENGNGGQLFFTYMENGLDYTDEELDPVTLTICLSNIGPADGINSIGGTFSSTFDWEYDPALNCFLGTQNQDIIGGTGGSITVDFVQTNPIECPTNQMGFDAIINPASCMNGVNQLNDDSESSFTCNMTLDADATIAGESWKDTNGNGIQEIGEDPVQGLVVILEDCVGNILDQTTTNADGTYMFSGIEPGMVLVRFDNTTLPQGYAFTYQDQGDDDSVDSDVDLNGKGLCMTLNSGDEITDYDAGLLLLGSIGDLVWHDIDGDGVKDSNEPGIEEVIINLYNDVSDLVATTVTDGNGYYLFDNVYPDTYFVEFIDPDGFVSTFAKEGTNDELDSDITNEIIIPEGGSTTGLHVLAPGENNLTIDAGYYMCIPIGETVWYDTDSDNVEDPVENGINGIKVTLWRLTNGTWGEWDIVYTGHKPGTPSDDGYYKFCAPPGTYYIYYQMPPIGLVQAQPNVGSDLTDSDVTNGNGPGTTNSFTVLSGEEDCTIGAGYYPMAEVGNYVWDDSNYNGIQDVTESPIEGVMVQVYDLDNNLISEVMTDDSGEYEVDYLQQQSYYLKFTPPMGATVTVANIGDDEKDSDVTNAFGENTTDAYSLNSGDQVQSVDAGLFFGVLPVDWLYIKVENRGDHNLVEWATATEINSDYFEVERKVGDDPTFRSISQVAAVGISNETRMYDYEDEDIAESGIYYYRIKQVDLDGRIEYSDILTITIVKDVTTVSLYPNPSINTTWIKVTGSEGLDAKVNVYAKDGKLVRTDLLLEEVSAGNYALRLDVSTLHQGVYSVTIKTAQNSWTEKLIVIR